MMNILMELFMTLLLGSIYIWKNWVTRRNYCPINLIVQNTLDYLMTECQSMGLGVPKEKDFVTADMEDDLWNKGILGESDHDSLRCTVFYFIGSRFGLRGGKEHCSLARFPKSQITIQQKNLMVLTIWCIMNLLVRQIREVCDLVVRKA